MTEPIEINETDQHTIEVRLDSLHETLWLTQAQIASLYDVKPQSITMHLKNIYADGELERSATCKDFLQVRQEGRFTVHSIQLTA